MALTNTVKANDVREALLEQGFEVPEDLEAPNLNPFQDGLEIEIWDLFWTFSSTRIYVDGYPRPISITDIYCYFNLVPPRFSDDLDLIIKHLHELDLEYLNIIVPRVTKERTKQS